MQAYIKTSGSGVNEFSKRSVRAAYPKSETPTAKTQSRTPRPNCLTSALVPDHPRTQRKSNQEACYALIVCPSAADRSVAPAGRRHGGVLLAPRPIPARLAGLEVLAKISIAAFSFCRWSVGLGPSSTHHRGLFHRLSPLALQRHDVRASLRSPPQ